MKKTTIKETELSFLEQCEEKCESCQAILKDYKSRALLDILRGQEKKEGSP